MAQRTRGEAFALGRRSTRKYIKVEYDMVRFVGGSWTDAAFLAECLHWTDVSKRGGREGWFFRTYQEWQDKMLMSRSVVDGATKRLSTMGFLETDVRKVGAAPRKYYRVDIEAFYALYDTWARENGQPDEDEISALQEPIPDEDNWMAQFDEGG